MELELGPPNQAQIFPNDILWLYAVGFYLVTTAFPCAAPLYGELPGPRTSDILFSFLHSLEQWFSKCGSQTGAWDLFRHVHSHSTYGIRSSGVASAI